MPSILEIKDLGELMKRGWSYRSVGSGSVKGVYCWKKYVVFDDGRKAFNNFVISDSADTYPNNGSLDGYYYEPIGQDEAIELTAGIDENEYSISNIESIDRVGTDTITLRISV